MPTGRRGNQLSLAREPCLGPRWALGRPERATSGGVGGRPRKGNKTFPGTRRRKNKPPCNRTRYARRAPSDD
eukprot:254153-Lingulodinium_polyedra.AAC.1